MGDRTFEEREAKKMEERKMKTRAEKNRRSTFFQPTWKFVPSKNYLNEDIRNKEI